MENELDLSSISEELGNISEEDLMKRLVSLRANQMKSAERNRNSPKAVEARKRQMAKTKAMIAKAKELGLWNKVTEAAKAKLEAEKTPTAA